MRQYVRARPLDVGGSGGGRVYRFEAPGGGRRWTGGPPSTVGEEARGWAAGSTKRFAVQLADVLTTASSAMALITAQTEVTKASRMRTATVSVFIQRPRLPVYLSVCEEISWLLTSF